MATYERDGLRLHYRVSGDGPPILFAHGMTGAGRADWYQLVARLSPAFCCIVPDLRGHARSDFREEDFSYQGMRDDLKGLLDELDVTNPHLIGFSLGAEVLLELELTWPGTAASMTLIGATTGPPPGAQRPAGRMAEADYPDWPDSLKRLQERHHGPDHWRTIMRLVTEDWWTRSAFTEDQLAAIGCPILLISGEGEMAFKREQTRHFAAINPRARYVEIPDAGHPVHVEQAATVNELILDFLGAP
jgi:3-oxoadipate enol-lactonase